MIPNPAGQMELVNVGVLFSRGRIPYRSGFSALRVMSGLTPPFTENNIVTETDDFEPSCVAYKYCLFS